MKSRSGTHSSEEAVAQRRQDAKPRGTAARTPRAAHELAAQESRAATRRVLEVAAQRTGADSAARPRPYRSGLAGATELDGSPPPASDPAPLRYSRADRAILATATEQHDLVTRAQLLRMGVSAKTVGRRLKCKLMRPLHRGVYFVGSTPSPRTHAFAAVLACGDRAWVSGSSASALWRSLPHQHGMVANPEFLRSHVDVIAVDDRRRPGIRVRRVRCMLPDEVTTLDRIPITTPARTLLELARSAESRELERAFVEMLANRSLRRSQLTKLLDRYPHRSGTARLRALLGTADPARTRSKAEDIFLALLDTGGIPRPQVNVWIEGFQVDFVWRSARVVVEIDGEAYHSTPGRFAGDRRRDLALSAAGYSVIRIACEQITNEPNVVLVQVAQTLARSSEKRRITGR